MKRLFLVALVSWVSLLPAQTEEPVYQDLPEEDEDLVHPTEYLFNPIQAAEEFRVGEFYWRRGSYQAAAGRYEEATKWNPGHADAFFKLGEAHMKLAETAGSGQQGPRRGMLPPSMASDVVPAATDDAVAVETDENGNPHLEAARKAFEKYLELEPKGGRASQARKQLTQLERR